MTIGWREGDTVVRQEPMWDRIYMISEGMAEAYVDGHRSSDVTGSALRCHHSRLAQYDPETIARTTNLELRDRAPTTSPR